ncbi:alpha/beta fold hydrolase [Streptomyces sp. NPDC056983]|uniref:alpha/beta fold hydrolase n=1 Tax=Streptomyces sp. NPDC056983 TaxID=3345987 RepID=UPI00363F34B8
MIRQRPDRRQPDLPPFVLLHGGRHGGWCWRRVARRLRARGHEVYAPTLTGVGERAHLLGPEIGLDTHIEDVVGVFEFEDIHDAVFVAHSYGGMPATGAMERVAERVRTLVYLDALMPRSGQSLLDVLDDRGREMMTAAAARGDGWFVPVGDASEWGVTDPVDAAWVNGKITAQPFKTLCDPVGPAERAWAHPAAFIECRPSTPFPLDNPRARLSSASPYEYRVIEGAHDVMVTAPGQVTDLLLEVSGLQGVADPARCLAR